MTRLSTLTTFYFKYVLQVFAVMWTLITLLLLFSDLGIGIFLYLFITTSLLWVLTYKFKPWLNGQLEQTENEFVFTLNNQETHIKFSQVYEIVQTYPFKFASIKIKYKDLNVNHEVKFIPRQSNVLFLLPFFRHPVVKELNEQKKNWH